MLTTGSPRNPQALASFNKTRAAFMQRASSPSILPLALKLAYLIAFKYMNRESRVAFVAQETLARDLNVTDRHVRRLADILQPLGLVVAPGLGRGKASTYWIDPDKAGKADSRVRLCASKSGLGKADSRRQKKRTPESALPYKEDQDLDGESYALPHPGRETFACANDDSPAAGAPPLTRHPAEEEAAEESKKERFAALRAIWARPWADDGAADRRAFAQACREAEPDDIMEGAKAWVAAFAAGDGLRYLPLLTKWLASRGWEKPPPTKPKGGNGAHRHAGRKPDLAEIGAEIARKKAAERVAS